MSYSLRGERVLVTGGAGTIGSHIVDLLVEAGAEEIIVLDNFVRGRRDNLARRARRPVPVRRRRRRHPRPRARRRADARDRRRLPPGGDPHHAVRRGAAAGPRGARRRHLQRRRGGGPRGRPQGRGRLVGVGLRAGRGVPDRRSATTRTPTTRSTAPPRRFNEGLLRSFHAMHGLDYVALRYFNVYGAAHGHPRRSTPRCWSAGWSGSPGGQPPLIFGDGSQTMDFVYVEDIARANILAAEADVTDEVFNVASGVETSLLELAQLLIEVMGADLEVEFGPERAAAKVSPAAGRHPQRPRAARLRGRDRPRGGAAPPGRVVAGRARAARPTAAGRR